MAFARAFVAAVFVFTLPLGLATADVENKRPPSFATVEQELATMRAKGEHQQLYRGCMQLRNLLNDGAWPDWTREQQAAIRKCMYDAGAAAVEQYLSDDAVSYDQGLQRVANVKRMLRDLDWVVQGGPEKDAGDMTDEDVAFRKEITTKVIPRGLDAIAAKQLSQTEPLVKAGKYYEAATIINRVKVDTSSPLADTALADMQKVAREASAAKAQNALPSTRAFYSWRAELYGAKRVEAAHRYRTSLQAADVTLNLQAGPCTPATGFTWPREQGATPVAIRLELQGTCNAADVAVKESTSTRQQTYFEFVNRVIVDQSRSANAPRVTRTARTRTERECVRYQSSSSYMGETCSTAPGSDTRVCRPNVDPNPKSNCVEWKNREVETGEYDETTEAVEDTVTSTSRTVREQVRRTETYQVKTRHFTLNSKANVTIESDSIRLTHSGSLYLSAFDEEFSSEHASRSKFSYQADKLLGVDKVHDGLKTIITDGLYAWRRQRADAIVANLPVGKAERLEALMTAAVLASGNCSEIASLVDMQERECNQILRLESKLVLDDYYYKQISGADIEWSEASGALGNHISVTSTFLARGRAARASKNASDDALREFRDSVEGKTQIVGLGAVSQRGNGTVGGNASALLFAVHVDQQLLDALRPVALQGLFGFEIGTNFGDRVPYDMYLGMRPNLRLSVLRVGVSGVVGFNGFKDKNDDEPDENIKASHVEPAAYIAAGPYIAIRASTFSAEFSALQIKRTGTQPDAARFEVRFSRPGSKVHIGGFWDVRGVDLRNGFADVTKAPQSILGVWLAVDAQRRH